MTGGLDAGFNVVGFNLGTIFVSRLLPIQNRHAAYT